MPFIAICPHCKNSQFRVPNRKRGTPGRCPKCHAEFPLVPQGEEIPAEQVRVASSPDVAVLARATAAEAHRMAVAALPGRYIDRHRQRRQAHGEPAHHLAGRLAPDPGADAQDGATFFGHRQKAPG